MLWIILGCIPLAILLIGFVWVLAEDEILRQSFLWALCTTITIGGAIAAVCYGLHQIGVIKEWL